MHTFLEIFILVLMLLIIFFDKEKFKKILKKIKIKN